ADSLPLITQKEERLLPAERTADRAAELVLPERRYGSRYGVEVILRIEDVVTHELERAAVEIVGARLTDNVDHRSGLASEFRGIRRFLDIDFLDGFDGRGDDHVVEVLVRNSDAIHQVEIVSAALAEHVDQVAGLLHGIAASAPGGPDHACAQHRKIE